MEEVFLELSLLTYNWKISVFCVEKPGEKDYRIFVNNEKGSGENLTLFVVLEI